MEFMMNRPQFEIPEFIVPPVMPPIKVKIYSESKHNHGVPSYETSGASGMDLRANETKKIYSGQIVAISTGIYVELPNSVEFQVRPRSGMSLKTKLRVANTPGTVDSCYRGEIKVILENLGEDDVEIREGDRIAQLVLMPVLRCAWEEVKSKEELSKTDRGEGGFGSTGTK
jgi:dUTP pyrophosphatase